MGRRSRRRTRSRTHASQEAKPRLQDITSGPKQIVLSEVKNGSSTSSDSQNSTQNHQRRSAIGWGLGTLCLAVLASVGLSVFVVMVLLQPFSRSVLAALPPTTEVAITLPEQVTYGELAEALPSEWENSWEQEFRDAHAMTDEEWEFYQNHSGVTGYLRSGTDLVPFLLLSTTETTLPSNTNWHWERAQQWTLAAPRKEVVDALMLLQQPKQGEDTPKTLQQEPRMQDAWSRLSFPRASSVRVVVRSPETTVLSDLLKELLPSDAATVREEVLSCSYETPCAAALQNDGDTDTLLVEGVQFAENASNTTTSAPRLSHTSWTLLPQQDLSSVWQLTVKDDYAPVLDKLGLQDHDLWSGASVLGFEVQEQGAYGAVVTFPSREQREQATAATGKAAQASLAAAFPRRESFSLADGGEAEEYIPNTDRFLLQEQPQEPFSFWSVVDQQGEVASPIVYTTLGEQLILSTDAGLLQEMLVASAQASVERDQAIRLFAKLPGEAQQRLYRRIESRSIREVALTERDERGWRLWNGALVINK